MIRDEQVPMLKAAVEDGQKLILIMQREPSSSPRLMVSLYRGWLKTVCSHLPLHYSTALRALNVVLFLDKSTPDQRENFVLGVERQVSYLDELVRVATEIHPSQS